MNSLLEEKEQLRTSEELESPMPLTEVEMEIIDLFVNLAQLMGLAKSIGEIYGLMFVSPQPLAMDEIAARLRMSKGSASQGLKFLRSCGAVKLTYTGARRDHFEAEVELRSLVSGFLKERVTPHLERGNHRLVRLRKLSKEIAPRERLVIDKRITSLEAWHRRGLLLLPNLIKLLGK